MIRRIVGRTVTTLSDEQFTDLRGDRPVLVDVGTGDGKHVVHEARRRPDWLVVGVDAAPAQLQKTSATAARKPVKGGVANALFVQASAESMPVELAGAAQVHVLMPWGSLLRGVLDAQSPVLRSLRGVAAVEAELLITLNLHAWRPPVLDVGETAEPTPSDAQGRLGSAYAGAGWALTSAEYLNEEQIATLATSWARRLNSTRDQFDVLALRAVAQ
jgi:16S rRNA (adenine(1408)-N(1))-methyltransferase